MRCWSRTHSRIGGNRSGVIVGRLILFVGRLVGFIHDNEAQVIQRAKKRGTGPHDDERLFFLQDLLPGLASGRFGQAGGALAAARPRSDRVRKVIE